MIVAHIFSHLIECPINDTHTEKSHLESKANLFITSFYGGGTFPENKLTDNYSYIIHVLSSVSESPFLHLQNDGRT